MTLWLLTASPAEGWSAAGAQGNPCIEQGIKGPAQGNASRPDRLRRTCRMASKALALPLGLFAGLAQEQEPGVRGDGRRGRGD